MPFADLPSIYGFALQNNLFFTEYFGDLRFAKISKEAHVKVTSDSIIIRLVDRPRLQQSIDFSKGILDYPKIVLVGYNFTCAHLIGRYVGDDSKEPTLIRVHSHFLGSDLC